MVRNACFYMKLLDFIIPHWNMKMINKIWKIIQVLLCSHRHGSNKRRKLEKLVGRMKILILSASLGLGQEQNGVDISD